MRTQLNLAIGAAVAALALSACGSDAGISAGTPVDQPSLVPARHASGDTRSSDLRDLARPEGRPCAVWSMALKVPRLNVWLCTRFRPLD